MQEIPIHPSQNKLKLFNMDLRRNDVALQLPEWKLFGLVVNAVFSIFLIMLSSSSYALVSILQPLTFFVQFINLQYGPWGSKEQFFYCNIDEQVKSGQNIVQTLFIVLMEGVLLMIVDGRFAVAAMAVLYRLDVFGRSFQENSPQSVENVRDLEMLHMAQPPRPPKFGIDNILIVCFALLFYHRPLFLIHYGLRAACAGSRDFGVISPIQFELYSDVITTASLNMLIVYTIWVV